MPASTLFPVAVRRFSRTDRDQVTDLVNAHIGAVVPNLSVSVQALLSQLEREPGEYVVDPWVAERTTLVAQQRDRIVAAAHLLRYADRDEVDESYRAAGEIRWLACWPAAGEAGAALLAECVAQLERWSVRRRYADGALPAPGVYGIPEQWPHVRDLLVAAGFTGTGQVEEVHLALVAELPRTGPVDGLTARRTLGASGTRISAVRGEQVIGYIEVDTALGDAAARSPRNDGWADIGNLYVAPEHRRRGVGRWLIGQAARWLELGGVGRLLGYTGPDDDPAEAALLAAVGFQPLTRTQRGWEL
jgi:GNAT superfamily N-acetyltransferase